MKRVSFLRELWDQGGEKRRFCDLLVDACGSWKHAEEMWWCQVNEFLGADEISALPRDKRFARGEAAAIEYLTQALSEGRQI